MTDSRGRMLLLWVITIGFAVFTTLTSLKPELMSPGMLGIVNTILLVAFALVHGITDYGAKTMAVFVAVCLAVSNFFENLSIVTGFPFGHYHYTEALGPKLFLVPVTIGGAYFGAGYLSWSVARVLLGRLTQRIDSFARWALPLVAGFLMTSWDFTFDPSASTIDHDWIWEHGGGFFGVPFENYLGWLLTVVIFFAIFAAYLAVRPTAANAGDTGPPSGFWLQAIVMYALLGARPVLTYLRSSNDASVADALGQVWLRHDIYETAALAAIFTVIAFSMVAALRLIDSHR